MAQKKKDKRATKRRLSLISEQISSNSFTKQPSSKDIFPSSTSVGDDVVASKNPTNKSNHDLLEDNGHDDQSGRDVDVTETSHDDIVMADDLGSEQRQHPTKVQTERPSLVTERSNKQAKKLNERSVRIDPAGYSVTTTDHSSYDDKALNPLNNLTKGDSFSYQKNCNNDEEPESELLEDTFTFLMTGKYPLEDCFFSKQIKHHFMDEEEEGNSLDEEEMENLNDCDDSLSSHATNGIDTDDYCLPFWLGSFIIVIQLFIYTLVIANVFEDDLPPNADVWLRLAQVFAVIVTLYTQSDFIDGIWLFTERWKAFIDITGPIKFNISAFFRVLAGNVGIFATFILVMYSEEVVDLLLNFTAMEFVATLDGSAFELAAKGFLGEMLEKNAKAVRAFRYRPRNTMKRRARCALYFFYIILVFAGFFVVVVLQARRLVGVDNEVYIQFDDTGIPELYGISGVYKGCTFFRTDDTSDIGYIDIFLDCPTKEQRKRQSRQLPAGSFVYCKEREGWVYLNAGTSDPCDENGFLIRSFLNDDAIPSNAFDILTHSKANWVVKRPGIGHEAILTNFVVESVKNLQSDLANCDGDGLLRTDKATSRQRPFQPLEINLYPIHQSKDSGFGSVSEVRQYSDFGQILRPLFYRQVHNDPSSFQVVLYDGLRWNRLYLNPVLFASHIKKEEECKSNEDDPNCWRIFLRNFRTETSWRSNSTIVFFDAISDPLMILSVSDTGVPTTNLRWYESRLVDMTVLPGQPKRGFNPEKDVAGYIDPIVQEYCSQGGVLDDYRYNYDYYYDYYNEADGEIPFFITIQGSFLQILENLCGDDKDAGKENVCNSLADLEIELTDVDGEDYEYNIDDYYYHYSELIGCNDVLEIAPFGFSCDLSSQFECNRGDTIVQINFATDFVPEAYRVIAFLGDNSTVIGDLEVANRTRISEQATEFIIPKAGLAELRFTEPNQEYLLSTCVPNDIETCVQVLILDSDEDGVSTPYELSYGNEIPIVGGGPGSRFSCRRHFLGPGCIAFSNDEEASRDGSPASSTNSFESIECSLYNVEQNFPQNVTGDIEIPGLPSKLDVIQTQDETFAVTADGWVTLPPETSPPLECEEGDVGLKIDVMTDSYPEETIVFAFFGQDFNDTLGIVSSNRINASSTSEEFEMSENSLTVLEYDIEDKFVSQGTCIPEESPCIQVLIVDTFGDGMDGTSRYAITYASDDPIGSENEPTNRGWQCRNYQFGPGCFSYSRSVSVECSLVATLGLIHDSNSTGLCLHDYPCPEGQFCDFGLGAAGSCESCENVERCDDINDDNASADCFSKCGGCSNERPCPMGQFCNFDFVLSGSCEFCADAEDCTNNTTLPAGGIADCQAKCEGVI